MKCSVVGCNFEGPRTQFIIMTTEMEIAGEKRVFESPLCYKCNNKYFEPKPMSVGFKEMK